MVTATGPIAKPLALCAELVAESETFIDLCTAAEVEDASTRVYVEAVANPARPFAVVASSDDTRHSRSGHVGGTCEIHIELDTPEAYQGDENIADALTWFESQIGAIIDEMYDLAQDGTKLRLAVAQDDGITLSSLGLPPKETQSQPNKGDYLMTTFRVEYGRRR
ncbi:hypothetical protein Pan216_20920 [Planctomycetes bacterium Pan216]|uniref:Uncharacterized protein n=1 Tax=Kolteria novifilia TaxID=2527975 RepID=A0A518B2N8_9BACT|nr:hypothetical protein Pan216_20920 [Planctomycetes bacterium Pan216]